MDPSVPNDPCPCLLSHHTLTCTTLPTPPDSLHNNNAQCIRHAGSHMGLGCPTELLLHTLHYSVIQSYPVVKLCTLMAVQTFSLVARGKLCTVLSLEKFAWRSENLHCGTTGTPKRSESYSNELQSAITTGRVDVK